MHWILIMSYGIMVKIVFFTNHLLMDITHRQPWFNINSQPIFRTKSYGLNKLFSVENLPSVIYSIYIFIFSSKIKLWIFNSRYKIIGTNK